LPVLFGDFDCFLFGELDCFLFGEFLFCDDEEDFFFIGDPVLLFFDEGLDDFELLDVFLADAMIG
jgi:hypothetical protein